MKICMYIPSLNGGGAERVFVNLANYFSASGIKTILVSSSLGVYGNELNKDVKFVPLPTIKNKIRIFNFLLNIYSTIFHLNKILKKEKPDIIFSTLALANIICYLTKIIFNPKIKLVTRQANVLNTASKNKILNFLLKKSFISSDLIIANSYETQNSIDSLCEHKEIIAKTIVIGNPVYSENILQLGDTCIDLSYLKYSNYILNVGRFTKEKDHATLLKAYKSVLNTHKIDLILLGIGSLENNIRNLAEELDISDSVHFVGFQINPYPYYKHAKVFALSSITEGFGNVLVEALSFGLPVVSTNCLGGPTFILDNGKYGTLVDVGDVKAFSEAIIKNINTEINQEKIIDRARDFSLEKIGYKYFTVLSNLKEL